MKINSLAIDFDGVVFRGDTPVKGVPSALSKLRSAGVKLFFLTNNSSKSRADYARKLSKMGIKTSPEDIFTSAYGASLYLAAKKGKKKLKILAIGEVGLKTELKRAGFSLVNSVGWGGDKVDYVVVGVDRKFTYAKLHSAQNALLNGAKFIACNTDPTWPIEKGFIPGSGSLVSAISVASNGKKPEIVIGKPNTYLLSLIQKKANCKKSELAMVDDRLDTGIAVANKFGITSILVLTGATSKQEGKRARGKFKPKITLNSLADVPKFLDAEATDAYVKKILAIEERHFKLHQKRRMSLKELDELCGVR